MKINFRSRFVIGAGVIILLLVMIGRGCSGRRVAGRAYRVEKKDIGRSFLERGQLMSLNTVPIELRASGEILELLSSGTSVTKGDVVALIDNRQSVENLENMEFDILVSKFEEEILKAERQLVDLRERNRIELLARQLEFAELEEKMAREGLTPEERRLLLIERGYAWIKHEDVCDELERQKRLFTRGYVPQSIIDRYEREAVIAKAYLDEKDAQIRIKEKGVSEERLLELEKEVVRIRELKNRSIQARERALDNVDCRLAVTLARRAQIECRTEMVRKEAESPECLAPVDGIVAVRVHRVRRGGGKWAEYAPGERKWIYDRIADIVNLGEMKVALMIHEADINSVKKDTPVTIRLPAYPDRVFSGRIIELGGIGRDRFDVAPRGQEEEKTDVMVFNAAASLDADNIEFRPGMSAIVEVMVDPPAPRLVLPREAVFETEEGYSATKKTVFGPQRLDVKGYPFNERYFLVKDGLKEGDVVLTTEPGQL